MNDLELLAKQFKSLAENPQYFGRMNSPDGSALIKGLCGDEMEFYITVQDQAIEDIKFFTNGCEATIACGEVTAKLACGQKIVNALGISPKQVEDYLKVLPSEHKHCAILAVSTFYRAIADYLLKP